VQGPDTQLNQQAEPERHSIAQSIALHLLPGTLPTLAFHLAVREVLQRFGLTEELIYLLLGNVLVFYPTLWCVLFYYARRRGNTGLSLEGIVVYQHKTSIWKTIRWSLLILMLVGPIFLLLEPVTNHIQSYFGWYPIQVDSMHDDKSSRLTLVLAFFVSLATTALMTPITEEYYYRGFLLPRMPKALGRAGPGVHSLLFAVSHFHQPWMIPVRTIGLLPLIYVTRITRSLRPGIVSHCLVNGADIIIATLGRLR